MNNASFDPTRRHFMRQACCAAVGSTGFLSALAQLRLIGAMAGDSISGRSVSDYKALVCLFLAGGNDANNIIVPTGSDYSLYSKGRTALALPESSLLSIKPSTYSDGRSYGLHPSLTEFYNLFGKGKSALLANVGTLTKPVTLAQYKSGAGLPPQLFSHSDQQVQWQSSIPDRPFVTGWGGRVADMVNSLNTNTKISMSISLNGANSFQVGNNVGQYSISPSGATQLSVNTTSTTSTAGVRNVAQKDILNLQEANLFEAAFGGMTNTAIADSALLSTLTSNPLFPLSGQSNNSSAKYKTTFPNLAGTDLAFQMRMIANLIALANDPTSSIYGVKRQIFFCRIGGWDLHAGQLNQADPTVGNHANLLGNISKSMSALYDATAELGIDSQVTTFTASDFSRTFTTNGDGSDHGWGGHHFIVGGAVKGGNIYGKMPSLIADGTGPDDTGRGRWIPSTSVDEYSATLASWFGVSQSNLSTVLPNIGRFATPNLGFV